MKRKSCHRWKCLTKSAALFEYGQRLPNYVNILVVSVPRPYLFFWTLLYSFQRKLKTKQDLRQGYISTRLVALAYLCVHVCTLGEQVSSQLQLVLHINMSVTLGSPPTLKS